MMLYVFRGIDGSKEKEKHRQISEKHGDSGKKTYIVTKLKSPNIS